MSTLKRRISIIVLSLLAAASFICSFLFGTATSGYSFAQEQTLTQETYLETVDYTVSDASGKVKGSVNVNAKNGGVLSLGPAAARTQYAHGISLMAVSRTQAATLTIPVAEDAPYTVFATDYGVDGANSSGVSAEFRIFVDDEKVATKTVGMSDFHAHFETQLGGVSQIRIEVYANEGTCVSFGNAAFYEASPNAVSMAVNTISLGGWPVPIQRNQNLYGGALKIGSQEYAYGFCVNSAATFDLLLDKNYTFFSANLGIDEGVAGGSEAGSVTVEVQALDKDGNVLRKSKTPTLYGYMQSYSLLMNVEGASRLRFIVGDGGNGIGDDMTVIGAPTFSMTMGSSEGYLSEFPLLNSSVGSGTVGIDKTSAGGAFSYQSGSHALAFQKGIGLSLKTKSYEDYLANPTSTETYSYAQFNVTSAKAEVLEGTLIAQTGSGAYAQIYADGELLADNIFVQSLANGGTPVRVSALLPENTATVELRLIAKAAGEGGAVDFVNARLFGKGAFLSNCLEEKLSPVNAYPFGRDSTPLGGEVKMIKGGAARSVSSAITLFANSSVTFENEDVEANMIDTVLGLQSGSTGKVTFKMTALMSNGSKQVYTSPEITANNSYYNVSYFTGSGVEALTLEVIGDENAIGVFGELEFYKSAYENKERISDLDWTGSATGWGTINVDKDIMGYPINVNGTVYERGISMHAFYEQEDRAYVQVNLPAGLGYKLFAARIGVTKDTANGGTAGSVKFYVEGDGRTLYASNLIRVSDDAKYILVDISGVSSLRLSIDNGEGSYDCDFAAWIDPVIVKSTTDLDDYLELSGPIANQSVASSGNNEFAVEGRLLGQYQQAEIFVNGVSAGTAQADVSTGLFAKKVQVSKSGKNVIRVEAGNLYKEVNIYVAGASLAKDGATLASNSTSVTLMPTQNGILITDISRVGGYRWLTENAFVRFPDEVRLGGEKGTPYTLNWNYVGYERSREDTYSADIDVLGTDYEGKKETVTYTYTDEGGLFTLQSIWTAQQDFVSPVYHMMNLINNSGERVFVFTADTLTATLSRPQGTDVTASYSYKGAVYETAYGYRLDTVTDGYDMNVFSSTDYNNGTAIDAGYIPWVSLHAETEGVNIGVEWSDCRVHVYGTGDDVYFEAGLRPRFKTEIPDGGTYMIPASFIDAYSGSVDDGGNQLKEYLFAFKMPEVNRLDENLPNFGANLWELLDEERRSWRMSDAKFYEGCYQLYEAGVDEIVIDTYWWKDISDWRGVHKNWQSSMTYSSNFVNSLDMDFGTYMQAGQGSSMHTDAMTGAGPAANPNWFARGENLFWDEVCFADPDAMAYLTDYLKNYYVEMGLDAMRTDFGYILGYCTKEGHQHIDTRADVGYWTSMNAYALFDEMYKLLPCPTDVNSADSEVHYYKWENCNCGGTLKDFASMSRATRIQVTDAYDPINMRRGFFDASYAFPSMQLMTWFNDYMYNPDGPFPNNNYRYWSNIMGATTIIASMPSDMPPDMYASFVRTIEIYHDWLQELVKYGDLYHILPRPDGVHWDGLQYYHPETGKGAVLAFKPDPDGSVEDTKLLKLQNLNPNATYYVWSEEGYIPFATYTGAQLMAGLELTMEESYAAEIIYYMDTAAEGAAQVVARPASFTVDASMQGSDLALSVESLGDADYYLVKIVQNGNTVLGFMADEYTVVSNVVKGLKAGTYTVTVQAINRFGAREEVEQFTVSEDSVYADQGYTVSGGEGGEIVIDGARYVNGSSLNMSDSSFGVSAFKTVTVTNLGGRGTLNIRLALDEGDCAQLVEVNVYGVKGGEETLLASKEVSAMFAYADVTANVSGYETVRIKAENKTPNVYLQSALGYGRTGLYGGSLSREYSFTANVQITHNGLNETFPRAGIFAGYVNDNNFAAFYLDAYYSNIVIYERSGSQSTDKTTNIKMDGDFDYYGEHTLSVTRDGNTFTYCVDGQKVATRTLNIPASKVALITEDAQARFANVERTVNGTAEELRWTKYNVGVNINGKTIYSTKVTQGVWSRPNVRLVFVLF